MKRKLKQTKGITLIALIITIIILLILAVVSIRLVMNNGILGKAESATARYGTEEEQEQIKLGYSDYQMAQASGKKESLTVVGATTTGNGPWTIEFSKTGDIYTLSADGKTIALDTAKMELKKEWQSAETITEVKTNIVLNETKNTKLKDEYGNKIIVPAGFKIKVDDDTNNATHVTEGIVVTDGINEFVWIPVGNIKTSTTGTTETQITLGRYSDFTVGATPVQTIANYNEQVIIKGVFGNGECTEDTFSNHDVGRGNAIAKDIKAFLESSNNNGGYYLGRYEARTPTKRNAKTDALTTLTENKNDYVYNFVTQSQASSLSQGMYTNKPFTSDLINSYAWDTAIIFVDNFEGKGNYAKKNVYGDHNDKGVAFDKICNIFGMASNGREMSTETSSVPNYSFIQRGGRGDDSSACASGRSVFGKADDAYRNVDFRPIIYIV